MISNDNDPSAGAAAPLVADAHGQAALLLVESLLHGLCDHAALTTAQAIEITDRAISVQSDIAEAADGGSARMWQSHALLTRIAASLRIDGDGGETLPNLA